LCCEGHEGMRSGMEVLMEGGERVVGRRYQISNHKFMFVPGFFPSLFAEIISSFEVRHVVGCEIWRDCLKVQVSGGLIVRLEIFERGEEPFFDLSVMKKEMKMVVGEVEDEVFKLLNRVDLMIMNKLRGEMRDGVSKRCVHPETLMMSLFLEGGEILDRNQVEYDEAKEDVYLLGSGLDGLECDLERGILMLRNLDGASSMKREIRNLVERLDEMDDGPDLITINDQIEENRKTSKKNEEDIEIMIEFLQENSEEEEEKQNQVGFDGEYVVFDDENEQRYEEDQVEEERKEMD